MIKMFLKGFFLTMSPLCVQAAVIYNNTFDDVGDLSQFVKIGENPTQFPQLPPLHSVSIDAGQLRIDTNALRPNGPGTSPVVAGRASMMLDAATIYGSGYNTTLGMNAGTIDWSINLSNLDGDFNNAFAFVLASSMQNPFDIGADGYVLRGGGMVGDRLVLSRFDFGLGGGSEVIVDLTDGLGTLPENGSFRVSYDPSSNLWALFGEVGPTYVDSSSVATLLGSGVDGIYTGIELGYLGLSSFSTGTGFFDNLSVSVESDVSSPSTLILITGGMLLLLHFGRSGRPEYRNCSMEMYGAQRQT